MRDAVLICPICSTMLVVQNGRYVCANRHSFDRAREGYVNLLRSKRTGDSKEMLLARRAFLDRGHYAPLADLLATYAASCLERSRPALPAGDSSEPGLAARLAGADGPARRQDYADHPELLETAPGDPHARAILDVGCGEGYYLDCIRRSLAEEPATSEHDDYTPVGIDSAREAIRLACRRVRPGLFAVADVLDGIPLATGAAQVLLNVFAPRNIPEFARVLAPGGLLLIVIPAPDHLAELRTALDLLSIEEQKEDRLLGNLVGPFGEVERRTLSYTLDLQPDDLLHLIEMTPNKRHEERGWRERLPGRATTRVRASFIVLACRRTCL